MEFYNRGAEVFIPDGGVPSPKTLERITHLGIGAHHDDLELMAMHGILQCYGRNDNWFGGVVVSDGRGSPREGSYAYCSDEEMIAIRREEQKKAAQIGEYAAVALLEYESSAVKETAATGEAAGSDNELIEDLQKIIVATNPDIIYTHNPADKHDTHVAVTIRVIEALRSLPRIFHPHYFYGCEVWRGLDWLLDGDKVVLDVSSNLQLAHSLIEVHRSQVAGGKRYDLAIEGRKRANATFASSHKTDYFTHAIYAMDLLPLVHDASQSISEYVCQFIDKFNKDVKNNLSKYV